MDAKLAEQQNRELARALVGQPEPPETFYAVLGRFVLQFAQAEATVKLALWRIADVKHPVGASVFSGVKIDQGLSLIGRIADAQKWRKPRKTMLKSVSGQLGQINALRNDLLHYGAQQISLDHWRISTGTFAHMRSRARHRTVTAETLKSAIYDLQAIQSQMVIIAWGPLIPLAIRRSMLASARMPWRYKQPSQPQPRRKNRRPARKRPSRPAASLR